MRGGAARFIGTEKRKGTKKGEASPARSGSGLCVTTKRGGSAGGKEGRGGGGKGSGQLKTGGNLGGER